jgi:hypothetical protein
MLKFEWNALRVDDAVLVHDKGNLDSALVPGVVVTIDTHRGVNGVGVRVVATGGEANVVWPSYLTVHRTPLDTTEPSCWRCRARMQPLDEHTPGGESMDRPT